MLMTPPGRTWGCIPLVPALPASRQTDRQTDRQTRVADNSNGWNWKLCSSGTTDALVVDVVMAMMMVVVLLLLPPLWCHR